MTTAPVDRGGRTGSRIGRRLPNYICRFDGSCKQGYVGDQKGRYGENSKWSRHPYFPSYAGDKHPGRLHFAPLWQKAKGLVCRRVDYERWKRGPRHASHRRCECRLVTAEIRLRGFESLAGTGRCSVSLIFMDQTRPATATCAHCRRTFKVGPIGWVADVLQTELPDHGRRGTKVSPGDGSTNISK